MDEANIQWLGIPVNGRQLEKGRTQESEDSRKGESRRKKQNKLHWGLDKECLHYSAKEIAKQRIRQVFLEVKLPTEPYLHIFPPLHPQICIHQTILLFNTSWPQPTIFNQEKLSKSHAYKLIFVHEEVIALFSVSAKYQFPCMNVWVGLPD